MPEIKRLTEGRGVDVAIEALGRQETFENALRAIRPGGTLSSLGVYSGKLVAPYEAFYAGLGDQKIVTTLCPGGKERMRRLMAMIANRRVDLTPLVTHQFALDDIQEAFDLFSHQRDGVLKVALYPGRRHGRLVRERPWRSAPWTSSADAADSGWGFVATAAEKFARGREPPARR